MQKLQHGSFKNLKPVPGFGAGGQLNNTNNPFTGRKDNTKQQDADYSGPAGLSDPDQMVTLGGDGTIMHAAHVFSGPVPPILPVAGGSMGFLTTFSREEILDAIFISLGLQQQQPQNDTEGDDDVNTSGGLQLSTRANNNMLVEDISRESYNEKPTIAFGRN